jgi:hypothetical protein
MEEPAESLSNAFDHLAGSGTIRDRQLREAPAPPDQSP